MGACNEVVEFDVVAVGAAVSLVSEVPKEVIGVRCKKREHLRREDRRVLMYRERAQCIFCSPMRFHTRIEPDVP